MPDTCPCQKLQSPAKPYKDCCQPFHNGQTVENCTQLMRSRFSAYVLGLSGYLSETWHSTTRPVHIEDQPDDQWLKLDIVASTPNTVHFKAFMKDEDGFACLEEVSNFVVEDGRLVYLDGDVRISPYYPQRNEVCLCGSGKKYKKCCAK